ncbi:F-box protein CPR1-like [Bidens hawaiensis]|uniref:F-box protein CPR1-like n=1 Tax=Bidens hawaiensis TaxID=980011 RepID=UPI00404B0946
MPHDLCEDLIVEIFSRLATKSLVRFRSVSKSLYVRIGSPSFIRLHTLRSPKNVICIHQTRCDKLIYTLLAEGNLSCTPDIGITPVEYPFKSFSIVGSCNGILCVYESGKGINLWNPSIRRKVTVPDLPSSSGDYLVHGFGFDPIIDDYKILRTTERTSFVYTMKRRTWCEIASPTAEFDYVKPHACVINGALHWVATLKNIFDECYHSYILTFDLSSETFSAIELPGTCCRMSIEVAIIKGCLAVISTNRQGHGWIWVRTEHNNTASTWHVAFKFGMFANPFKGARRVFECATNGDLLFIISNCVGAYDLKYRIPMILQILTCSSCVVDMDMCVESLVLLDMGTSCDPGSKLPMKKREAAQVKLQI